MIPLDVPSDYLYHLMAMTSSQARRMWREAIFERDGHSCVYCGSTDDLTLDHVKPRCKGGPTNAENCVTACRSCNLAKGSEQVEVFLQVQIA